MQPLIRFWTSITQNPSKTIAGFKTAQFPRACSPPCLGCKDSQNMVTDNNERPGSSVPRARTVAYALLALFAHGGFPPKSSLLALASKMTERPRAFIIFTPGRTAIWTCPRRRNACKRLQLSPILCKFLTPMTALERIRGHEGKSFLEGRSIPRGNFFRSRQSAASRERVCSEDCLPSRQTNSRATK